MIFRKLKKRSLKKVVERQLAQRDTSGLNAKVKSIGFLVDEAITIDFEPLFDFYREIEIQPKNIKVFSFVESKKKLPSIRQNQVQRSDFDWRGNLLNDNAQEFIDHKFDVLVGLYGGRNDILETLVASSKANFKVGFAGADDRLFDLLLAVKPQQVDTVKTELAKYLKVLGKL